MGLRGKPAEPKAAAEARGTKRSKYERRHEPEPAPSADRAPDGMHPAAVAVWDAVAPGLIACGVLCETDRPALARYCDLRVEYQRLRDDVLDNGSTAFDDKGREVLRPSAKHLQSVCGNLLRLEQHFGLTPAARSNVKVDGKPTENDPLDAILKGRGRLN